MKHIYLVVFSLILFNFPFARSQDMRATTKDGETVILRKNGNWFYFKPFTGTGQKNNLPAEDTRALMSNRQIVVLKKDGTWIMTNNYEKSISQNPNFATLTKGVNLNPNIENLTKTGYMGGEHWETHHAMLEKPAPALELSDWMNGNIPRNAWAGKIVVVDFWATWCGPCKRSIPHNNELFQRYKNKDVLIIGACGGGGEEKMVEVVEQLRLEYPTAKVSGSYTDAWNVSFFPTYAIVDRKGNLRALGVSPEYVEPIIQTLLEEPQL